MEYGYRMDFVVEELVVIELKRVEALSRLHEAQILTYVKFAEKPAGLLINFNTLVLKDFSNNASVALINSPWLSVSALSN